MPESIVAIVGLGFLGTTLVGSVSLGLVAVSLNRIFDRHFLDEKHYHRQFFSSMPSFVFALLRATHYAGAVVSPRLARRTFPHDDFDFRGAVNGWGYGACLVWVTCLFSAVPFFLAALALMAGGYL